MGKDGTGFAFSFLVYGDAPPARLRALVDWACYE